MMTRLENLHESSKIVRQSLYVRMAGDVNTQYRNIHPI